VKETIKLSDKDLCIIFHFEDGTVAFRNFRVETLLPKKLPEFTVGFDEIGKNTVSHFNAGTKPLKDDKRSFPPSWRGAADLRDFCRAYGLSRSLTWSSLAGVSSSMREIG